MAAPRPGRGGAANRSTHGNDGAAESRQMFVEDDPEEQELDSTDDDDDDYFEDTEADDSEDIDEGEPNPGYSLDPASPHVDLEMLLEVYQGTDPSYWLQPLLGAALFSNPAVVGIPNFSREEADNMTRTYPVPSEAGVALMCTADFGSVIFPSNLCFGPLPRC